MPTLHVARSVAVTGLTAGLAVILGCQESTRSASPQPPITLENMRQYVTRQAEASLDGSGRFKLRSTAIGPDQITRERAVSLAAIWPRQFGAWLSQRFESEHGAPIQMETLIPCGEAAYAASAYQPIGAELVDKPEVQAARRVYGPWWIVTLCSIAGTPQLSVAVAAYSKELKIDAGEILFPRIGGEFFSVEGIPRQSGWAFLDSPERAVQRVSTLTGLRVSEAPELIVPDRADGSPIHSRWRLRLERPMTTRTQGGRSVSASELHSWRRPGASDVGFLVAASAQPDRVAFQYAVDIAATPRDKPMKTAAGFVMRRPDVATRFEPILLRGGNQRALCTTYPLHCILCRLLREQPRLGPGQLAGTQNTELWLSLDRSLTSVSPSWGCAVAAEATRRYSQTGASAGRVSWVVSVAPGSRE